MKHPARAVEDFTPFISGPDAPILVGGQAVNLWCLLSPEYSPEVEQELASFQPFTSKDCDVIGDRNLLDNLAKTTGLAKRHFRIQPTPCLGYLYEESDPGTPVLEVLRSVHGLSMKEVGDGQTVEWDEKTFRTLSPLKLLKAKIANAHDFDQKGRQDVRHIQMLIPCTRAYLNLAHTRAVESASTEDLKFLKLALTFTANLIKSSTALEVAAKHGINFERCFDKPLLRSSPLEAARNFHKHQLRAT